MEAPVRYGKKVFKFNHLTIFPFNQYLLHQFAIKLGLKKRWYHDSKSYPHYDVTISKKNEAIRLGAISITVRELVKLIEMHKSSV